MNGPVAHPPREGLIWLQAVSALFRPHAMRWVSLTVVFMLVTQLLGFVPVLGMHGAIPMLVKPLFAVGFLAAAWHLERKNEAPSLRHLLAGFKSNIWSLLSIGAVLALGFEVATWLATLATGIPARIPLNETLDAAALAKIVKVAFWTYVFILPVTLATWFAPALVVFGDQPVMRALQLSLRAALMNLAPLIVFLIGVLALWTLALLVAVTVGVFSPPAMMGMMAFVSLPLLALVWIVEYVSYRRVFHSEEPLRLPQA